MIHTQNDQRRDQSYLVKKFTETDIIKMLEFLIDNLFVLFGGGVFQETVDIHMGRNCALLLDDFFLYS